MGIDQTRIDPEARSKRRPCIRWEGTDTCRSGTSIRFQGFHPSNREPEVMRHPEIAHHGAGYSDTSLSVAVPSMNATLRNGRVASRRGPTSESRARFSRVWLTGLKPSLKGGRGWVRGGRLWLRSISPRSRRVGGTWVFFCSDPSYPILPEAPTLLGYAVCAL